MSFSIPKLELFVTDLHAKSHDPQALKLELQTAKTLQPDLIWFNGDNVDAKSVSRFRLDPREKRTLKADIESFRSVLKEFREACPKARIVVKSGNHDVRVQNYIWDNAEELADFEELSMPRLLGLKKLDISYVPDDKFTKIGELWHLHGHEIKVGSAYPAQKMIQKTNVNTIFGHTHRLNVAYSNSLSGKVHVAWNIGCTQSLKVDFDLNPQWTQSFAYIEYLPSGVFHVNAIPIFVNKGRKCCIVYGKLYST